GECRPQIGQDMMGVRCPPALDDRVQQFPDFPASHIRNRARSERLSIYPECPRDLAQRVWPPALGTIFPDVTIEHGGERILRMDGRALDGPALLLVGMPALLDWVHASHRLFHA